MAKTGTQTTEPTETAPQKKGVGILTKMTVSTMGCNPGEAKAKNQKISVAKITGIARGLKAAVGKDGDPLTGITGNFLGVNMQTGEVTESGVLYLPSGIAELLIAAVEGDGELDEAKRPIYNSVKFGFEIFAVPAKNPIGYSYEAKTLIEAAANPERDEFLAILGIGGGAPQIAAN